MIIIGKKGWKHRTSNDKKDVTDWTVISVDHIKSRVTYLHFKSKKFYRKYRDVFKLKSV